MNYQEIMPVFNNGLKCIYVKVENSFIKLPIRSRGEGILSDNTTQNFDNNMKDILAGTIKKKFYDFNKEPIDYYSSNLDKNNNYFCTPLTDDYNPFEKLFDELVETNNFNNENFAKIDGFYFLYMKDDTKIYLYQKKKEKKFLKKSILFTIMHDMVEILNYDIFAFTDDVDLVICKDAVYYYNPKIMEENFNIENRNYNVLKDKISTLSNKYKELTGSERFIKELNYVYRTKLNSLDNSEILKLSKENLISIVQGDSILSSKISIKDGNFEINNITNFKKFINLMSDDYLKSSITNVMYISDSKRTDE